MKEVRKSPANRCFGNNTTSPTPEKEKKDAVKAVLQIAAEATARKRAEAIVKDLLPLSRGSLIKLLPVIARRVVVKEYPKLVLVVLVERIRRNQWDKLSPEDRCLVIQTEASLAEKQTN